MSLIDSLRQHTLEASRGEDNSVSQAWAPLTWLKIVLSPRCHLHWASLVHSRWWLSCVVMITVLASFGLQGYLARCFEAAFPSLEPHIIGVSSTALLRAAAACLREQGCAAALKKAACSCLEPIIRHAPAVTGGQMPPPGLAVTPHGG